MDTFGALLVLKTINNKSLLYLALENNAIENVKTLSKH